MPPSGHLLFFAFHFFVIIFSTPLLAPLFVSAQAPLITRTKLNDAEALLEFLTQLQGNIPQDWNLGNTSMVCSWFGIQCKGAERVSVVDLKNTVEFVGSSADMLLRLDALQDLVFPTCRTPGFEFPPDLVALPSLFSLVFRGCKFATFPPVISPSLRIFTGIATNVSVPLPNTFAWSTMIEMQLQRSELRCPLPQGLIDRASAHYLNPGQTWICNLSDNHLRIEDGKICGQINPKDFPCKVWPQRPEKLDAAPVSSGLVTSIQQWHVELKEIEIRIFRLNSARIVQRDNFLSITVCPPQPATIQAPKSLDAKPLQTFRWFNESVLRIDLEFRSRTDQVMAGFVQIDFNPPAGNVQFGNHILSVTTQIRNFNVTIAGTEYPHRLTTFYLFKAQHSLPGTRAPACWLSLQSCNSSLGELSATIRSIFATGDVLLVTTMVDTELPFGLVVSQSTIDGVNARQSVGLDFNFWGLGDAIDINETAAAVGLSAVPYANAVEDQAVILMTTWNIQEGQTILGLLEMPAAKWFEPAPPAVLIPNPEPIGTAAVALPPDNTVGTIVGIVIAVVAVLAIVAGGLLLRRKMLRDRQSRTAAVVASVELLEEQQVKRRQERGQLVYMQQLGVGSSGSVMLATLNGAFVAVKRLHESNTKSGANRKDDLRLLLAEADTMASVQSNKNVVKLIEIIEEEEAAQDEEDNQLDSEVKRPPGSKGLAIAMEFCPRGSLANHLKKQNQLTDYDMFKFSYGISNGMAALALAGVVHRDLACRNVLLSEHLHAKVSDFGLATRAGDTKAAASDSDDLGPLKWQAPEVVASGEYSEKSDVWAYGCCLIEIATGQTPFQGFKGSILDLRTKIQTQMYSPLQHLEESKSRDHRDKIPEWMGGVLRSCFQAIPSNRPSFREIRYALGKAAREWKNRFEDEVDEIESMLSSPGTYSESYSTSSGVSADSTRHSLDPALATSKTLILSRPALSTTAAKVDLQNIERLSKLGSGSFGSVFLGQSQGVYVAMKVLDAAASKEDEVKREADVMLSIKPHRNIVQIYGLISQQEQLSIVMEFAPRGSLESYIFSQMQQPQAAGSGRNNNKISEAQFFRWSVGIARGMASLSSSGVIHRDLAIRNILLDSSLEPKVSDFGLARTVLDPNQEAHTKTDIGPIRWFAPECYDLKYSEKSDVWAFGCTLVEMMTGNIPFGSMKLFDVVEVVRDKGQSPVAYMSAESAAAAPKWLKEVARKCCVADAAQRPSFKEIVSLLEEAGTQIAEVQEVEAEIQKRRNRRADTLRAREAKTVSK